jgi:hypothetical protein
VTFGLTDSFVSVSFPPSATPYVLVGIQVSVSVTGTGFTAAQPIIINFPIPALAVPAGQTSKVVYTMPLTTIGSLAASLGPDTLPPAAPVALIASASSASSVALTWSVASDNVGVSGYAIWRCAGAGCSALSKVATSTVNSFTDSGLAAGQSYTWCVSAFDAAGNSSACSNSASATMPASAPSGNSPDGSTAVPGATPPSTSQTLTTAQGTWSFGSSKSGGGFALMLSGRQAGGGFGVKLYVANGGQVYTRNDAGNLYLWGSGWTQVASTTVPP